MAVTRFQFFGEALRAVGWADRAERAFRSGADRLTAAGETGWNSTQHALLALVLCDLGRFDDAEEEAGRSLQIAAEDDFASQCEWRMARARVLSHRREHEAALALADEAVAIVEPTDYLPMKAECHEVRAGVLAAMGRAADAADELRIALELFERKGVVPAIERVRGTLASSH
jgi:tetratricopeptide (TPR) repeat protein